MATLDEVVTAPPDARAAAREASPELAREIAQELYIWAYPMVLIDVTGKVTTNYEAPTGIPGQSPVNQMGHAQAFPPGTFRQVVRPNFDTLYSAATCDLSAEPLVLTLPKTDRFHVFQMMDGWSEVFAAPGTRMNGGAGGNYLIAGPRFNGNVPAGLDILLAPTDAVWVVGRIQTNGPADYDFVHSLQKQIALVPLSAFGKPYAPPRGKVDPGIDMKTPPMITVDSMNGQAFFTEMTEALKKNPPHVHDQAIVARMRRIGLTPGRSLDFNSLPFVVQQALSDAPATGLAAIRKRVETLGTKTNGWTMMTGAIGYFGADYMFRAAVALFGLGANRPEDAIYPSLTTDSTGAPLTGVNRYTLRFEKNRTPPVNAFWSVTMYDEKGFPVENPIKRFAIGDRDNITPDGDGSLTIYIQRESPGAGKESNWLPAPAGPFTLLLRLYSPASSVAAGDWSPPVAKRVS
jgi:hypothetical protein